MFGLLLTLCGSVLLAIMVAIRNRKEIGELTEVRLPEVGKVSPKVLSVLLETYYFRGGLGLIAFGALLQIFPEVDLPISKLDILQRLIITIVGFIAILYTCRVIIAKVANINFKKFPPYSPPSSSEQPTVWIAEE